MERVQYLKTHLAPQPGAYSQAALVDLGLVVMVYTAGVTGNVLDQKDEPMIEGGLGPQVTQTLSNIFGILNAAYIKTGGGESIKIVSMDVLLHPDTTQKDWVTFNKAYEAFFEQHAMSRANDNLPPRASVGASWLPLHGEGTLVEMKAVAAISK